MVSAFSGPTTWSPSNHPEREMLAAYGLKIAHVQSQGGVLAGPGACPSDLFQGCLFQHSVACTGRISAPVDGLDEF